MTAKCAGWELLNLPLGPLYDPDPDAVPYELDSAHKRGLLLAGTLLRVEGGEYVLVGHINRSGGVCDDCRAFSTETLVEAYRIVWCEEDEQ